MHTKCEKTIDIAPGVQYMPILFNDLTIPHPREAAGFHVPRPHGIQGAELYNEGTDFKSSPKR